MKTFTYTVTDELGIHARPVGPWSKRPESLKAACPWRKDRRGPT